MAQYIDKNKVIMWIMEELNSCQPAEITSGKYVLPSMVNFINTLEIKDIDKIREEIEKRYEYYREKEHNSHSIETEARMSECQHLLLLLSRI